MLKFALNDKTDKIFPLQQFVRVMRLGAVLLIPVVGFEFTRIYQF